MRVASELEQVPGVTRAALLMATPANRALLAEAGLLAGEALAARPDDLVIAVAAVEDATAEAALARAERLLARRRPPRRPTNRLRGPSPARSPKRPTATSR